ncbi:SIR2 family protein [Pseudomonas corrugata]|uniref:SIR2 family protein n=1 Tax=Pseudomonas corrugata TaxID=47879 RepID=UPI003D81AFBD
MLVRVAKKALLMQGFFLAKGTGMNESVHNPDQYMFGFRQVITNGKKKIGILLGAGAPVSINVGREAWEPLIPNVVGLTRAIKKDLSPENLRVFNEIESSIEDKNFEKVLSKIRALADVIGTSTVYGFDSNDFTQLTESICNAIKNVVDRELPSSPTPYCELVSWINGINRKHGVEVFTTNYDLLLEQALERVKTPYFDGFSGSRNAFFDPSSISRNDLPPRWVRLWKLHGSIGWEISPSNEVIRIPHSQHTSMVYPSHIKYDQTQAAPFSSLFERFKNFLLEPDTLLISTGFSYADAHITSKIIESLIANPSAALFAFQYNNLSAEPFARAIAMKCPNVSVFCRDGAIINGVEAKWRTGILPAKNWQSIREEYFKNEEFLLGDFKVLTRFLATAGGEFGIRFDEILLETSSPPSISSPLQENEDDGHHA